LALRFLETEESAVWLRLDVGSEAAEVAERGSDSSSERLRFRTFLPCERFLKNGTLGAEVAEVVGSDMPMCLFFNEN